MLDDFKDFLTRGNLLELAVAFIMATAFGVVVNSLVGDLIMPLVAALFGKPSFDALTFTVNNSVFAYGTFLTNVVNFLLVAAAVFFFVVKPVNAMLARMNREQPAE